MRSASTLLIDQAPSVRVIAQRLRSRCRQPHSAAQAAGKADAPAAGPAAGKDDSSGQVLVPPPPPPLSTAEPAWVDEAYASRDLDLRRRVFCNRSLNMAKIRAIGLDMDYTLAQYKPETFEVLAYTLTQRKLIDNFGYPRELESMTFDWRYMMRGLTIDKARGNILKLDRHKYVKLAYHGFKELSREERLATYIDSQERCDFDEPEYALIDTLFSLAEAHLFMQLVELQDAQPALLPKPTASLYKDVRAAVDLCHRDGSLKSAVAEDPAKYIYEDARLGPLLEMLRASGRKVFLATNSLWDYTHIVMNFLLGGRTGPHKTYEWTDYFDAIVTGCGKPDFFIKKKPLFEVHVQTGMLMNTDGGTPMVPIGEEDLPSARYASSAPRVFRARERGAKCRVFQGGFFQDLHRMLDVSSGAEVLYLGDHIYGDILRAKKTLGWRTMLVVPELEAEMEVARAESAAFQELRRLRLRRDDLEDQLQRLEWAKAHPPGAGAPPRGSGKGRPAAARGAPVEPQGDIQGQIAALEKEREEVRQTHRRLLRTHHQRFHKVWGQLLKTGYQNSRFAHQVERFACLYTSHVSNLHFYSPNRSYRGRTDSLAHEEDPAFGGPSACLYPRRTREAGGQP